MHTSERGKGLLSRVEKVGAREAVGDVGTAEFGAAFEVTELE